jgi:hypothetical protein
MFTFRWLLFLIVYIAFVRISPKSATTITFIRSESNSQVSTLTDHGVSQLYVHITIVSVLLSVLFLVLYSCHTGVHSYTYMVMWTYNWEPLWSVSVVLSVLFLILYSCHTGAHSYTYMVMWTYNCEPLWSVSVLLSVLLRSHHHVCVTVSPCVTRI